MHPVTGSVLETLTRPCLEQDHAEAVGGDSGDSQPDAGVRRSRAIGGLRQPPGRHNKGLDQSETEQQDRRACIAGEREHVASRPFRFRPDPTTRSTAGVQGCLFTSERGTQNMHK